MSHCARTFFLWCHTLRNWIRIHHTKNNENRWFEWFDWTVINKTRLISPRDQRDGLRSLGDTDSFKQNMEIRFCTKILSVRSDNYYYTWLIRIRRFYRSTRLRPTVVLFSAVSPSRVLEYKNITFDC